MITKISHILLVSALVFLVGCGAAPQPAAPSAPAPHALTEAVLDYASGSVTVNREGSWKEMEIGDKVGSGITVKTAAASEAEFRIGTLATVRLKENTTVQWDSLLSDGAGQRSQLQVLTGEILNKVSKLAGKDSYLIRTPALVMGVRGTQFLVNVQTASTLLSVKEGAVALLPPAFDPARWGTKFPDQEASIESLASQLLTQSAAVEAGQSTDIALGTFDKADKLLLPLVQNWNPEAVSGQGFRDAAPPAPQVRPLSPSDLNKLLPLDTMPLGEAATPAALQANPAPAPAPAASPTRVLTLTAGEAQTAALAIPGGVVVSNGQGRLKAFSLAGTALWSADVPGSSNPQAFPSAEGAEVFWVGDTQAVVLDAATGRKKLTLALDAATGGVFGKRLLASGNRLYLGASDGIAVFDRASGAKQATLAFAEGTDMTPALLNGQVVAVGRSGTVYAFAPGNPAPVFQWTTLASQPVATAPVGDAKRIWFGDRKGLVLAVDRTSSKLIWSVPVGAAVFDQPLLAGNSLVVFAGDTAHLLSVDTGAERAALKGLAASPLFAAGQLWGGTTDGKVHAWDPQTGKEKWNSVTGSQLSAPPTAWGGEVAFPLEDGRVLIVNPKALP